MKSNFFPNNFIDNYKDKEYVWLYNSQATAIVKEQKFSINICTKDNLVSEVSLCFQNTQNIKKLDFYNGNLLEYTEEDINTITNNFRGIISGYPKNKLYIQYKEQSTNTKEKFECDAIRIEGGNTPQFPNAKKPLCIKLYKISKEGKVSILKVLETLKSTIYVDSIEHIGQIPGLFYTTLSPSAFDEYIDECKVCYMGRPKHYWVEVYGNETSYSNIQGLYLNINFNKQILSLQSERNLSEKTYTIRTNSSMDPGDDECIESRDLYIWAHVHFNTSSLLDLMSKLLNLGDLDGCYIKFNKTISTIEFEQQTGIHLSVSIIETQDRY